MRRTVVLACGLLLTLGLLTPSYAVRESARAAPPKWTTTVFADVPAPGYPAHVYKHRNGRVYAGTYVDSGSRQASRIFEWSGNGTLTRSWTVPGQVREGSHGVQAANQTRTGKLVLLETSRRAVMTLNLRTGRFRTVATLPPGSVPNYATWGPGTSLYVTDYAQGVIWKVRHSGQVTRWFASPALEGEVGFGTTGIVFRPGARDLLITQQTTADGSSLPTNGHLYRLALGPRGGPRGLRSLWTSQPTDLPDGFGIGRSGHLYVAMAGLTAQLVELTASGVEVDRFPDVPFTGDNGSPIPFDTPSNAAFHGTRVLVANQSAVQGDAAHQAILAVEVGERGRRPFLPRRADFR